MIVIILAILLFLIMLGFCIYLEIHRETPYVPDVVLPEKPRVSFEVYCSDVLRRNNFTNIRIVRKENNLGIDIMAIQDNMEYIVFCIDSALVVGQDIINKAKIAKEKTNAQKVIIMSNSNFSTEATKIAEVNSYELWDRNILDKMSGPIAISEAKQNSDGVWEQLYEEWNGQCWVRNSYRYNGTEWEKVNPKS